MARRLCRKLFQPRRRPIRRVFLRVTQLEERAVPAGTYTWDPAAHGGDGTTWDSANNWDNVGGTDAWPGQSGTNDNVVIGTTMNNIVTKSNFTIGSLNIAFGAMTGSLTINLHVGGTGLQCTGTVTLALGAGKLTNNDILVIKDGASDNTWTSGNILGAGGLFQISNNTGMTFRRATEDNGAPSPAKIENNIQIGTSAQTSDASSLTIANLNQNIIDDSPSQVIFVFKGATMAVKTSGASPYHLMGATDTSLAPVIDLSGGVLYRDCGTAAGNTVFTLGYALDILTGGAMEIYDAPNANAADELDFSNWLKASDGTLCDVLNEGGSVILGQAPDPNRSGTATLGVTAKGLYQTSGHLETKGTQTEEIDTGSNSVLLKGGDMTFSADNPQAIGYLNVKGNFEFGAGSTWNWYATATRKDQLNVLQVNGAQGNVKVDPGGGGTAAPSIVCNAPAGMQFTNIITAAGTVTDSGNPTNFTLSNGFSGKWNGKNFEIDS
jgi:hypothetical protein